MSLAIAVAACATAPVGKKVLPDFLHDGTTRREDVYLRLGEPSSRFEASRLIRACDQIADGVLARLIE